MHTQHLFGANRVYSLQPSRSRRGRATYRICRKCLLMFAETSTLPRRHKRSFRQGLVFRYYHGVRSNHLKLPSLLRSTFTQVSQPEYKTALLDKGMKEAEIALLDSLPEKSSPQTTFSRMRKKRDCWLPTCRSRVLMRYGKRWPWCAVAPNWYFRTTLPDTTCSCSAMVKVRLRKRLRLLRQKTKNGSQGFTQSMPFFSNSSVFASALPASGLCW